MNPEEIQTIVNDFKMLEKSIKDAKKTLSILRANAKHCKATGQVDCVRNSNLTILKNRLAVLASYSMGFAQVSDDETSEGIAALAEALTK